MVCPNRPLRLAEVVPRHAAPEAVSCIPRRQAVASVSARPKGSLAPTTKAQHLPTVLSTPLEVPRWRQAYRLPGTDIASAFPASSDDRTTFSFVSRDPWR